MVIGVPSPQHEPLAAGPVEAAARQVSISYRPDIMVQEPFGVDEEVREGYAGEAARVREVREHGCDYVGAALGGAEGLGGEAGGVGRAGEVPREKPEHGGVCEMGVESEIEGCVGMRKLRGGRWGSDWGLTIPRALRGRWRSTVFEVLERRVLQSRWGLLH